MFPLRCIYTGYTLQHGNSILYRDNTCFVNELYISAVPQSANGDYRRNIKKDCTN
eukprot:COSAG02_NODE_7334_length_3059_cov_2.657770_3_plen_55_part_00